MVQKSPRSIENSHKHPAYRTANVLDRSAAFVIDFALVFFCHSLLSFYIKAKQNQAIIEGYNFSFVYWLTLNVLLFLLLYFSYHYFALTRYHTTLGKKIFHLKLRDVVTNKKPGQKQYFSYALWKTLALMSLGFLFWGVISDKRHRAWHEKLSDIRSLSLRNQDLNNYQIRDFIKGFLLPMQVSFVLVLIYSIYVGGQIVDRYEDLSVLDMSMNPKCEDLDALLNGDEKNRLEAALSYYAADVILPECLEVEAQAAFEKGEDTALANLAFSNLMPSMQDNYKEEACKDIGLRDLCTHQLTKDSEDFKLILEARALLDHSKYKKSLNLLKYVKSKALDQAKNYLSLQSLYEIGKQREVLFSMQHFLQDLPKEIGMKHKSWLCQKSIAKNCHTDNTYCKSLIESDDLSEMHRSVQLTYVDVMACEKNLQQSFAPLEDVVREYQQALYMYKVHGEASDLNRILSSQDYPVDIKTAASRYLSEEPIRLRQPASSEGD